MTARTWEQAALEALNHCDPHWDYSPMSLEANLIDLEQRYETTHGFSFDWLALPAVRGYLHAIERDALTDDIKHEIITLLAKKQHDYGHDNILKHGVDGVRVRIWDKIARLKNLQGRYQAANESVVDTWLDVIGYCVIGVMLDNGTFTLPLEADLPYAVPAPEDVTRRRVLVGSSDGSKPHSFSWDIDEVGAQPWGDALWTILDPSEDDGPKSLTVNWQNFSWTYEVASDELRASQTLVAR